MFPIGKVVTFYSYKGGTGRSMALANVAWILASHEKRVLMIDWDLEAPGLHRYFHPFLIDPELTASDGLIDWVWNFAMEAATPTSADTEDEPETGLQELADLGPYTIGLDYDFGEGRLDFIPAGRQGSEYSAKVNGFNWQNFYSRLRGGVLLEKVRSNLKRDYDFVLIDSRTGVSDTSGICTVQMPDQLVACFTCNNQSIRGAAAVVESIFEQREKAGRSKDLQVFPVLMRIDLSEKDKLDTSRSFARKVFSEHPAHLDAIGREGYWRKSEVLYHAYYSYEEILATFGDSAATDNTLLNDFETLANHITDGEIRRLKPIPELVRSRYKERYLRIDVSSAIPPIEFEVAPVLELGRLPTAGPFFVGREAELSLLDKAWEDTGTHVLTFVAFGGVGKSALVGRWLDRMAAAGWRGARRGLAWSFYSQGTEERVISADRFLDHALGFFGDPNPSAGTPRDRGLRLAELVQREKTLLVLDGVEPLQHPPSHPLAGRLKDPGLSALLKSLATGNPGLCIVTTRERIADLESFPQTAPQVDLETLSPEAGVELLLQLGVKGKDSELRTASAELGNHALALNLFGNYLGRAYGGDVRRRREVDLGRADQRQGGSALRVIRAYTRWLGDGSELAVLRLLGLFDRPAAKEALAALRARPKIPGLTEPLVRLSEEDWLWSVSSLREHGFLLPADPRQPDSLDAHPLVRVYFQEELERERPAAWQEGNLRLYEHLKGVAPEFPETLDSIEPLFTAVLYGCRAGRQQEAMDDVYWRRIQRREEAFSWRKLGAFGSNLAALSGFFDRLWDSPSTRLSAANQAFVLNQAAFCLRALGRLAEAIQPMQAGLERNIAREDWKNAAIIASNLSELALTLGEVGRAVAFGEQSVALADRSGDAFWRNVTRTTLADALHQTGRWEESVEAFRTAEALQAEWQPQYPRLYSLQGYRYCNLLLSREEPEVGSSLDGLASAAKEAQRFRNACMAVRERAVQTLEVATQQLGLLSIALDHLSLGRAHLGLALTAPKPATSSGEAETDFAQAAAHLDRAVEGLRRSGNEDELPRGLLARAASHRLRGNGAAAVADLSEALEIADRGGMRLHACDAHLEWARLELQQGNTEKAREHVAKARQLVNETGYKREREVAWLERRVGVPGNAGVSPAG